MSTIRLRLVCPTCDCTLIEVEVRAVASDTDELVERSTCECTQCASGRRPVLSPEAM